MQHDKVIIASSRSMPNNFHPLIKDCGIYALRRTDPEGRCTWNCHVLHESVWKGGEKERKRGKGGKKLPAISTRSWILCSEQNIVRARDDNISGKWVNGVVLYIYIYLSKIRKEAPFYLGRNWVRGEKKRPWENLFYGRIGKKKSFVPFLFICIRIVIQKISG